MERKISVNENEIQEIFKKVYSSKTFIQLFFILFLTQKIPLLTNHESPKKSKKQCTENNYSDFPHVKIKASHTPLGQPLGMLMRRRGGGGCISIVRPLPATGDPQAPPPSTPPQYLTPQFCQQRHNHALHRSICLNKLSYPFQNTH